MASWLSFGAPCNTVWGSISRGAECSEENRRDEIYNAYVSRDEELFQRSLTERATLFNQYSEVFKTLGVFILVAAFIIYYLRD